MKLNDLRNIVLNERETGKLSEIPPQIFENTHKYLINLQQRVYDVKDPLNDEARLLVEEILSIKETIQDISQIRFKKILSLAATHSELSADREEMKKMHPAELEMYKKILTAIDDCRKWLTEGAIQERIVEDHSPITSVRTNLLEKGKVKQELEYVMVRILTDIDAFLGVDGRIYTVKKGDITTLPKINADVLCDHNIALNIRPST